MYWYGHGMNGWGYAFMTIAMVIFWGLVVAATVALVRYLDRTGEQARQPLPTRPLPEQLLAERFARDEIDEEGYRQRLATLHARPTTPS